MGWTESPKSEKSEIFENRPGKIARNFFVRGVFRRDRALKWSTQPYPSKKTKIIKKYVFLQKVFFFSDTGKSKNPGFWRIFYDWPLRNRSNPCPKHGKSLKITKNERPHLCRFFHMSGLGLRIWYWLPIKYINFLMR